MPGARRTGMRRVLIAVLGAGVAALSFWALSGEHRFGAAAAPRSGTAASLPADWPEPISPLSPATGIRPDLVDLGARLFSDRRLSAGARSSCATCHRLDVGGGDGRRRGVGHAGEELLFNVPSIFNAWKNYRYNWRGNFATLEEQNEAILLDPHVMGSSWPAILSVLGRDVGYAADFRKLFGRAPDRQGVLQALGAFQRSLTTTDGRFDRYLRGETGAITPEEAQGYALFKSYGCISCHQGENVGGNLMQRFPLFPSSLAPADSVMAQPNRTANLGRYALTGLPDDRWLFRVPSLRNVASTAPYFHDGRAATLADAVSEMAASQLGRSIPESDIRLIVKFLVTLSGRPSDRAPAEPSP